MGMRSSKVRARSRWGKRLPFVPNREELLKLLSVIDDARVAMIVFVSVFHGLRISEIVCLKWEDVDLKNGELFVRDAKNTRRYQTDYGQDRIVPINDMFLQVWKMWRYLDLESEYVLRPEKSRSNHKSMIKRFQDLFNDYLRKADLWVVDYYQKDGKPRHKFHMHSLRHVCGCNLRRCGMSIADIQDFLGHSDIETTMLYAKITKDDLKQSSHLAYAYPKSHLGMPEQPIIQVVHQKSEDVESLRLQNENLKILQGLAGIKNELMVER